MESTTVIALSLQGSLRRQMDVVANNIANMNTTGFKGEKMMFVEHLVRSKGGERILGEKLSYVRDIATVRDTSEGPMEKTGNPLDVAVRGKGYFSVETPDGRRYTRNGNFRLDEGGRLVNSRGQTVMSDGGQPFFFGPEDRQINIARDGTISTAAGPVGRLSIVSFEDEQELKKVSGGLFSSEIDPRESEEREVVQGMLESSNIEPILEMTRMIETNRAYDGVRSLLEKEDERVKKMFREFTTQTA